MRVGARPEGVVERLAVQLDLVPLPLADTHLAFTAARAIMAGASVGVFDAISAGATSAETIATECQTDARATRCLLECLVALGYLRIAGERYSNTRRARKWLLARSPSSIRQKLLFQSVEWDLLARLEGFVRTGLPIELHRSLDETGWRLYQRAMAALASTAAPALARRLPLPRGSTRLLDIGGGHGLYSVALCHKHPGLHAVVLDLPAAVARNHEEPPHQHSALGERLQYLTGDALRDELGEEQYDVILAINLVHHFSDGQNEALARRVARALRPRGIYVIADFEAKRRPDALDGAMNLYFALTSRSGTWPLTTMRGWQTTAGLVPRRALRLLRMPGFVVQVGRKPARYATCSLASRRGGEP